jgi:hypothetical protein
VVVAVGEGSSRIDLESNSTSAESREAALSRSVSPKMYSNSTVSEADIEVRPCTVLKDAASDANSAHLCSDHSQSQSHRDKPQKLCGMVIGGAGMRKLLSFLVGILHGIAGPGGVLAVLPAVQLHDWRQGLFYLMFFSVASTLTMGFAAGLYGAMTSRLAPTIERRYVKMITFLEYVARLFHVG